MYIESMTLSNFRCFGENAKDITFTPDLTVFVGANGSGKTAVMHALLRLFGLTREQRSIVRTDFHFGPTEDLSQATEKRLFLDVRVVFPEISKPSEATGTVLHVFNNMCIASPGEDPVCRIRLEATWINDNTPDGTIEERVYWVETLDSIEFGDEVAQKHRMNAHDRGLIQVHYVPATRDGIALTRNALGHMTSRLIKAIAWKSETKETLQNLVQESQTAFAGEPAIHQIATSLGKIWAELNASHYDATPALSLLSREFEEVIKKITVIFQPTEDGRDRRLEDLSDGQKSLFYLALSATVFKVEREALQWEKQGNSTGFSPGGLHSPALTIFALEEPENHLAPFYLSRIVRHMKDLANSPHAMAVFSSHSPGVLGRIAPEEVRHFRLEGADRTTSVNKILLPAQGEEAAKYVREAVIAYPELYFARFVILGEGDSEQIVLPKLAEAMGLPIDPSFVAVVPLGGRHVNHFWRLLNQLGIPYCTLLDLDLGRAGGGFGRIKNAANKLLEFGSILGDELTEKCFVFLKEEDLLPWDESQLGAIDSWCQWLEGKGVFLSGPLDLDMLMLMAFPDAYQQLSDGERGPQDGDPAKNGAFDAVLKSGGCGQLAYAGRLKNVSSLMGWYRYRFLSKSKPAAHIRALSHLTDEQLIAGSPPVLKRMLLYVKSVIEDGVH
ncbi:MAG: AAA family ATPase [Magnetococcales bacterium]|nr:AAA family ATPase [Magnetococcales bacterium]